MEFIIKPLLRYQGAVYPIFGGFWGGRFGGVAGLVEHVKGLGLLIVMEEGTPKSRSDPYCPIGFLSVLSCPYGQAESEDLVCY